MTLTFTADSVVVIAGVPGAGKTTLIRRAVDRDAVRVVDTEDRRDAGRRHRFYRGYEAHGAVAGSNLLLYPGHYARIVAAVAGRRPVVIHSRGTLAASRRAIALLARLRGRPAHLVLLDAERAEAEQGQAARGRTVDAAEMTRQFARWRRLRPAGEGWASVVRLDRRQAARVEALDFVPVPSAAPAPATI